MNQMDAVIHAMFEDDCDISFQALPERQEGENIEVSILYGKAKNQEDKYV